MTAWPATHGQAKISTGVTSRFAPSPTGRLHLGHAFSALLAHDFARTRGGRFLLRIEDVDAGRAQPAHVEAIMRDLAWLGIAWDAEVMFQSSRLSLYGEALERLRAAGLVYPCFCTRSQIAAEIAASVAAPHAPESGDALLYPGTCRRLAATVRKQKMAEERFAWRLDVTAACLEAGPLYWQDGQTEVQAEPERLGDVVVARKDAPVSYHLAVTLDDAAQGVTDVVRGRDLYASTDVHRLLQHLLGLPTPHYHHHPLLADERGRRLAKRHDAPFLEDMRSAGVDPQALKSALLSGRLPDGYRLL